MEMSNTQPSDLVGVFAERELDLIRNCRNYVSNDPAGLPGHNLMVIIAKMSDLCNVLMSAIPNEEIGDVMQKVAKMYDFDSAIDPSKVMFGQIKTMMEHGGFIRRDIVGQRRTVEEVALAQGRNVIFICPDGLIRNKNAVIIGKNGRFHDEEEEKYYRESIPFSFADEVTFNEWLAEAQSNKDKESK